MSTAALSLDKSVTETLEAEAFRTGSNAEDIATVAILRYFETVTEDRRIDAEREKEFLSGAYVSDKVMDGYMDALFQGKNPTAPKPDVFIK